MTSRPRDELNAALGYRFQDSALLEEALTHSSVESGTAKSADYERLEFLGDRVLALVIADHLLKIYPGADAGTLALQLTALVRAESLTSVAIEIELGDFLFLSHSERASGGMEKPAILADACEAVIGALFLDGGLEVAAEFIHRYWDARAVAVASAPKDAKTALQEWAHAHDATEPVYTVTAESGPPHDKTFTIEVEMGGVGDKASGQGSSKRRAQQAAATALLEIVEPEV